MYQTRQPVNVLRVAMFFDQHLVPLPPIAARLRDLSGSEDSVVLVWPWPAPVPAGHGPASTVELAVRLRDGAPEHAAPSWLTPTRVVLYFLPLENNPHDERPLGLISVRGAELRQLRVHDAVQAPIAELIDQESTWLDVMERLYPTLGRKLRKTPARLDAHTIGATPDEIEKNTHELDCEVVREAAAETLICKLIVSDA